METKRTRNLLVVSAGLGLIGLGVLFLLAQIFRFNIWNILWPFFIIVPGLLFFVAMVAVGRTGGPLAVPGAIVTMVGILLLYQSVTGHWTSWAYAWALIFPTAVGIGIAIAGLWGGDPKAVRVGTTTALIGLAIFLFFGLIFELLFNISGLRTGLVGRIVLPLLLVGAGAVVLIWALLPRKDR